MANRPMGYGLSSEVQRKIKGKYSVELEQQSRLWIEAVLDRPISQNVDSSEPLGHDEFHKVLKDGKILCELMNRLQPGSIKKINESTMPFKLMENIEFFLNAAIAYGVKKTDLFQTVDLYEKQNMVQVNNGIHALGRLAQKNGFRGPFLGPKESQENPRNFDEATLKAGETIIGLQSGTNRGASQKGMNFGKSRSVID